MLAVCSQAFGSFQGQSHEAIPPERRAENQRNDKINWEQRLDLETLAKPEKQHTLGRDPVGWLWCHQSIRASVVAAFKSFSLQVRYHSGLVHIVKPMCMANRNQSEN